MTFPRNVGQIPIFYNVKNTGRPFDEEEPTDYRSSYLDVPNSPLYPFGHGLSYTNFEYSNLTLDKSSFSKDQSINASITITNIGEYDGEEVVQLYIQDIVASVTRPVKELKGFEKIALKKGKSKTVTFTIDEKTIEFYGIDMKLISESGDFNLWVGKSSDDNSNHIKFSYN